MIRVSEHPEGAVLPVRAKAGAKSNAVGDEHDGALRVSVTTAPEQGKANEAIVTVLAEALHLRRSALSLLTGETARDKKFLVRGMTPEELLDRIDAALTPTMYEPPDADV